MQKASSFWKPNIDRRGRLLRLIPGIILCLVGIGVGIGVRWWLGLIAFLAGAFMIFEAFHAWCLLRAWGMKTRL